MAYTDPRPQTVNATTGFTGSTPTNIVHANSDLTAGNPTLDMTGGTGMGPNNIKVFSTQRSDGYGGWIGADIARQPGNGVHLGWTMSEVLINGESSTGFSVEFRENSKGDLILLFQTADYVYNGTHLGTYVGNGMRTHAESNNVGDGTSSNGHAGYAYIELALNTNGIGVRVDGKYVFQFGVSRIPMDQPWWSNVLPSGNNSIGIHSRRTYSGTEAIARTMEVSHHITAQDGPSNIYVLRHADETATESPWVPNVNLTYGSVQSPNVYSNATYARADSINSNSYIMQDDRGTRPDGVWEQSMRLYGTNYGGCMSWYGSTNSFVWVNDDAFGFGRQGITWANGY